MSETLAAIVLAGGRAKPEFTAATGVTNRALAELSPGKAMLDYILDALKQSSCVDRIFIVGDVPSSYVSEQMPCVTILKPGESLIDNILIGFNAAKTSPRNCALLVSADIPFITPDAIDDYYREAAACGADICYPIIPMQDYVAEFGQMKRTTLKLREGRFTGGNVMLVRAGTITNNPAAIHRAYAARKSVPALGRMLGWGLLLRILFSQIAFPSLLNVPLLETAVGRVLGAGVHVKAIVTNHASLGTDVDKPDDVVAARAILAERASGAD